MSFVALKIDIVRSRRVPNRQQLQDNIFGAVSEVNELYASRLTSRLTVTHGDEVQGMLTASHIELCLPLCEHFIDRLYPQSIRFGIGIGGLSTKVRSVAIGMDGEAWHRAQSAVERARKRRSTFVIKGLDKTSIKDVNAMIDFLLTHRLGWTRHQREAARFLNELGSQQAVASHLGISAAAVSKRLTACMWDKYAALRETALKHLSHAV